MATSDNDFSDTIDYSDLNTRLLMAILQILSDKSIVSDQEIEALADQSKQLLQSEEDARKIWHTTWLLTRDLAAMTEISSSMVVLDAGSGFGGPARELAETFGCRVIGIDRNPLRVLHSIRQTRKMKLEHLVSFCWGVFENLPFPDKSFDIVWAQASLTRYDCTWQENVPTGMNPEIFRQFWRVLREKGQIVADVWLKGPVSDTDVTDFLDMTGFDLVKLEDCTKIWLECILWAIDNLHKNDERRASWASSYEESIERKDKLYQFVASKVGRSD